tara:strand:- start:45 stop:749 length:705 start_codon:yes stop_codon:yes gene_type:complete
MSYDKRLDGRKQDELRPIEAKVGVIKNADGSAFFRIGKTSAYVAVYGPKNIYPKFLSDPTKSVLRCHYNMMPFSGMGDRVRPGTNRRSKEISMVTENALLPVMDLKDFPNSVIDVYIELPQTDAGSRCAGICAASLALADAGFVMKDLVAAVAVGRVDDKIVVDLDYQEEALECENGVADIPVAVMPQSGKITLLQMDGVVDPALLKEALQTAQKVSKQIYEVQKEALKAKYKE